MTLDRIKRNHAVVKQARVVADRQVFAAQQSLDKAVQDFIRTRDCSLRAAATTMGFTVAYLSDIMKDRRRVSDSVVERLERLK